MPTATRICKVCGKEYEYCHTLRRIEGVFRYQDVACCPEHGSIYLAEIEVSRANGANQVAPHNEHTKSSLGFSDLAECDGEDSWFENDFDEEDTE